MCILAFAVLRPGWGAAGGLLAGVVAVVVITTGFLTLNTLLDGRFEVAKVDLFARPSLCLGLFLGTALLPVAPVVARLVRPPLSGTAAVCVVAAATLVVTAAVLPSRAYLVDRRPVSDPLAGADVRQRVPTTAEQAHELATYFTRMEVPIYGRAMELEETLVGILADEGVGSTVQADSVETEVTLPLRDLRAEARSVHPGSDRLAEAHEEALAALRSGVDKSELIAQIVRYDDASLLEGLAELQDRQDRHWDRWFALLEAITDDLGA